MRIARPRLLSFCQLIASLLVFRRHRVATGLRPLTPHHSEDGRTALSSGAKVRVRCGEARRTRYEEIAQGVNAARCQLLGRNLGSVTRPRDSKLRTHVAR
jgi:hypothetical protein